VRIERSEPKPGPAPAGSIASEVVHDVRRLVDLEVMLVKQELKELALTNAIAAACAAAAATLAVIAVLVAIPVLIVVAVPWKWEAALVWVVAYLAIAVGLAMYARSRMALHAPRRTIDSLKENKEWVLRQPRSTGR
jgi:cytochrome c biogenesis protein CcdA